MVHRKIKDNQLKAICKVISNFHRWRKLEIISEEESALNQVKHILGYGEKEVVEE